MRQPALSLLAALVAPLALVSGLLAGLGVQMARAQGGGGLSGVEMALADCVGQALAIEETLRAQRGDAAALQAATARADAILTVAVNRYVGVGRVDPFHRRAALTLAAESLRMRTAVEIAGNAQRVVERTERDFDRDCGPYLD